MNLELPAVILDGNLKKTRFCSTFKRGFGYNHILQRVFNFLQLSFMKKKKKKSVQHLYMGWESNIAVNL